MVRSHYLDIWYRKSKLYNCITLLWSISCVPDNWYFLSTFASWLVIYCVVCQTSTGQWPKVTELSWTFDLNLVNSINFYCISPTGLYWHNVKWFVEKGNRKSFEEQTCLYQLPAYMTETCQQRVGWRSTHPLNDRPHLNIGRILTEMNSWRSHVTWVKIQVLPMGILFFPSKFAHVNISQS